MTWERWCLRGLGVACMGFAVLADHLVGGAPGFGTQQVVLAAAGAAFVLLSLAPTRVARTVLVALVAGGLALATAEFTARRALGAEFAVIHRLDDDLLYAHAPGSRKIFVHRPANGGRKVEVRINAHGFRGPELRLERDRPRVVVLGDSNVAAAFSTWEESFCGRLEAGLGRVEVVNTGVMGYGPDQSLLLLEREFERLEPQVVVAVLFADNDFGDLVRNKLFRLDENGEVHRQPVRPAEDFRLELELTAKATTLERMVQRARWRRSDARRAGVGLDAARSTAELESWLGFTSRAHAEYVQHPDGPAHAMFLDHYDADVALEPWRESAVLKRRLMRGVLARLSASCAAREVPVLFVVLPSRVDLCADADSPRIDRERWPAYRSRALTEAFLEIAEELAVPYVDLEPHFRAGEPCALYLRGGDAHWNEAGQALAATIVAERVRALLPMAD